jgi:hypothetical protein
MWSFRRSTRPLAPQPSVRLRLEVLDLRLPPSSLLDPTADDSALTLAPTTDTPTQVAAPTNTSQILDPAAVPINAADSVASTGTNTGTNNGQSFVPASAAQSNLAPAQNNPPQIINFQGVEVVGGLWRFTGDVIDQAPAGLVVRFGGEPVSLQGVTATTDANGHFDKSVLMNTDGSDNGAAATQTTDGAGVASNIALCNIRPG